MNAAASSSLKMENAYKPPDSAFRTGEAIHSLDAKMYKISGMGIATVVGGLLAGGLLLAKNFKVVGNHELARKSLIYSALGMLAVFGIAFLLPESWNFLNVALLVLQLIAIHRYAKLHQEASIKAHVENGGPLASNWQAAGVGLLVVLALVAVLVFALLLLSWRRT
jgi:hypothetical protein